MALLRKRRTPEATGEISAKPKRTYNKRDDQSPAQQPDRRNKRTQSREERIRAKALELGFKSKSDMLTAIINGSAIVTRIEA